MSTLEPHRSPTNPDSRVGRPILAGRRCCITPPGSARVDTLTLLLDAGADVNAKNRRGSTPLHWAIHDEAKVRLLLLAWRRGQRPAGGRTHAALPGGLDWATATRSCGCCSQHGADPNIALANGRTPLMAAAGRGDVEAMRLLLDAKARGRRARTAPARPR